MKDYRRAVFSTALDRLSEPRRFIQVLAGPRQVGKTTLALQLLDATTIPSHYASADDPTLRDRTWLEAAWDTARARARGAGASGAVLVLDEVQKVPEWSEIVKRLWDEDTRAKLLLRVVILGSAPLLVQKGLSESLAGRFEVIRLWHWSFREMREAFGWDLDHYIYFGGYPGSAPLIADRERWLEYIRNSLIETTVSRDVLLLTRVDKPALLRQLVGLGVAYSAQIVSYTKLIGQLQDAGNTTTLAHYLDLLSGAGLISGLRKFSGSRVRQRSSSPKLLALNNALISAQLDVDLHAAKADPQVWGRLVETAVGSHLVALARGRQDVMYWREGDREVDYVTQIGGRLYAIEVASGWRKGALPGLAALKARYPRARPILIGAQGIPLDHFLEADSRVLFAE